MRAILLSLALTSCTAVTSTIDDVIPANFGQVYDCDLTINIGAPTNQVQHFVSHPCLADENAESAYEQTFVDETCDPYLRKTATTLPGSGGCYGGCHLKDDGFDICTVSTR